MKYQFKQRMVIAICIACLYLGCGSRGDKAEIGSGYKNAIFGIYTPYGCYYNFILNNRGEGYFISAFEKESIAFYTKVADSLINKESFNFSSVKDSVSSIIQTIKKSEKQIANKSHDAFRFTLTIDNVEWMSVYKNNKEVDQLLKLLLGSMRKDSKDDCGVFALFKSVVK